MADAPSKTMPAQKARKELESKSHLNKHQIDRVLGDRSEISVTLVATIIKISDDTDRYVRTPKPGPDPTARLAKSWRPNHGRKQSLQSAKELMAKFGEIKAL